MIDEVNIEALVSLDEPFQIIDIRDAIAFQYGRVFNAKIGGFRDNYLLCKGSCHASGVIQSKNDT